jgi:hypothetical protein
MTALAATDVTVTLGQRNIEHRPGTLRKVYPDLTFGDSALTYPSGGIPLPAKGSFGFLKQIVFGSVEGPATADAYVYRYDRAAHTLMIYQGGSPTNPPIQVALAEITGTAIAAKVIRMQFVGE